MMPPPTTSRLIRFGIFEVDLRAGEVYEHGVRTKLQQQPFQVLAMLLEHAGDVVTREELRHRLWPEDTFVDFDQGLNKAVKKIRQALGDSPNSPRFIETLPKRGYRFIASVESRKETSRPNLTVAENSLLQGGRKSQADAQEYNLPRQAFGVAASALLAWLAKSLGFPRRPPRESTEHSDTWLDC
jgi:DNA-binding winged helix-turn-helix (wHTH) protein